MSEEGKINITIQWRVAGLIVEIKTRGTGFPIELPCEYQKFFTSDIPPQKSAIVEKKHDNLKTSSRLTLTIQDSSLKQTDNDGKALLKSNTWEFWLKPDGNYEFILPYEEIPVKVFVQPDFSEGVIQGDFSSSEAAVFPLKNIENRIFSAWLGSLGDIILHASGVMLDGKGYCFLGDPGAGKSTLAAALAASPRVTVLGEDQIVLRYLEGLFWIFGAPWHINPDMCSPEGVPLKKLFFLDRSLDAGASRISPLEGVTRILQTAFIPFYQPQWMPGILEHLELLSQQIPFYTLSYKLGIDPVSLIINI